MPGMQIRWRKATFALTKDNEHRLEITSMDSTS